MKEFEIGVRDRLAVVERHRVHRPEHQALHGALLELRPEGLVEGPRRSEEHPDPQDAARLLAHDVGGVRCEGHQQQQGEAVEEQP